MSIRFSVVSHKLCYLFDCIFSHRCSSISHRPSFIPHGFSLLLHSSQSIPEQGFKIKVSMGIAWFFDPLVSYTPADRVLWCDNSLICEPGPSWGIGFLVCGSASLVTVRRLLLRGKPWRRINGSRKPSQGVQDWSDGWLYATCIIQTVLEFYCFIVRSF